MTMKRLVIDTDPGVDDAHALMMALACPQAKVEAITTVAGNVSLVRTTANALTVLDIFGRDVPVYPGCNRALLAERLDASYVHGDDGLGNSNYPASRRRPAEEHAVRALIRLADGSPGELTLVAIGPLTNLALATRLDPDLPTKYARLVVMGGAIRSMGNTPNPSVEFNLYSDPEAGAIVFGAWKKLTLVSWETTMAHPFSDEQIDALGAHDNPRSEFFRRITANTVKFIHELLGRKALFAPDPLAVAVAMFPDIVTASEDHYVQVELSPGHTRGQTTVDWFDRSGKEPNVELVLEVDRDRLWKLMEAAVV
jgi:purine nucleosidase